MIIDPMILYVFFSMRDKYTNNTENNSPFSRVRKGDSSSLKQPTYIPEDSATDSTGDMSMLGKSVKDMALPRLLKPGKQPGKNNDRIIHKT